MITADRLADDDELVNLWRGAIRKKIITSSMMDSVNYFAAAECALEIADPPESAGNLFAWIVMGKRWDLITDSQEDKAIIRLKRIKGYTDSRETFREDPRDRADEVLRNHADRMDAWRSKNGMV